MENSVNVIFLIISKCKYIAITYETFKLSKICITFGIRKILQKQFG
jgi:hypothetical protein